MIDVILGAALHLPAPAYPRLSGVQMHLQKHSMCLEETSYDADLTVSKTLKSYKVGLVLQSLQDLFC